MNELKKLRILGGMTQSQMAEKSGLSKSMYASIEKGVRCGTFKTWEKIQEALGIPDDKMWAVIKGTNDID